MPEIIGVRVYRLNPEGFDVVSTIDGARRFVRDEIGCLHLRDDAGVLLRLYQPTAWSSAELVHAEPPALDVAKAAWEQAKRDAAAQLPELAEQLAERRLLAAQRAMANAQQDAAEMIGAAARMIEGAQIELQALRDAA